jgi:hypothetical protein
VIFTFFPVVSCACAAADSRIAKAKMDDFILRM